MALEKNQLHTVTVTGMSSDGSGIARIDGLVVFVKGALLGEICEIKILKVTRQAAYAKIERIVQPSGSRIPAACPSFGKCGGCDFLHTSYEEELRYKRDFVDSAFKRIGGLDLKLSGILGASNTCGYRNKVVFAVGGDGVGFYRERSHDIIPAGNCLIQPPAASRAADAVLSWMQEFNIPHYSEATAEGDIRRIFIRQAFATDQTMVCVVSASENTPHLKELAEHVRKGCPSARSILLNINSSSGNAVLGKKTIVLDGSSYIEDKLLGNTFRLSLNSFYQINREQAELLYKTALELAGLTGAECVLDLYCGAGTIGICAAPYAGKVVGVEIVPSAVSDANINAKLNGTGNIRFLCSDASNAVKFLQAEKLLPDVVIVDPPRKGLAADVIDTVVKFGASRIVYVSCDPATLARDLKLFAPLGYTAQKAVAVDMFPRTRHVETVVLLSKQKPEPQIM